MNESLKSKIMDEIYNGTDLGITDSAELTDKIAAIVDGEMIETRDAVKRLIAWAAPKLGYSTSCSDKGGIESWQWRIYESQIYAQNKECPQWLQIAQNGKYTPAAIEEGLRDLFVSMLGVKDDNDNHAEP